jgi:hypothetical protein
MYKLVFKNSRIALIFAALTLFSAMSMVGTSEDGGALVDLKNMSGEMRAHAQAEAAVAAAAPASTQTAAPVFGDYDAPVPRYAPALDAEGATPASGSAAPEGITGAPLVPTGTNPNPTKPSGLAPAPDGYAPMRDAAAAER